MPVFTKGAEFFQKSSSFFKQAGRSLSPNTLNVPMRSDVFQPYPLIERVELCRGQDNDSYESIIKLSFALPNPTDSLGFGQPATHIKIRQPNSEYDAKAYSLITSPTDQGHFSIIVKVYRGGFMSGYLSGLQVGEEAHILHTPTKQVPESKNVGLIAFGIGITEMIHTAKQFLQEGRRVTLVHALPYSREVLFNQEFQQLRQEFPDAFKIVYFFSREKCPRELFPHAIVHHGRFDASSIQQVFDKSVWKPEESRFLVIGNKPMKINTYGLLASLVKMLAFDASKRESLQKLQDAIDKSPKGSIDAPIVDMIEALNAHPNYVTSSSCSGRIAVFCGVAQNESTFDGTQHLITKGGKWLVSSHAPVSYAELYAKVLADPSVLNGMVIFKHEPFIMHVQCRDEEAAKVMLQCGLACGFRESGIVLGNKKTMVAIRTTANSMEIPIALNGKLMVDEQYLQWILAIANEKFEANRLKTQRFMEELDATLFSSPRMLLKDIASTQADSIVPRAGHSSILYKKMLYIVGGQGQSTNGTARLSDLVLVDSTTKNVIKTISLSMTPRMYHTAIERQGKLILFGGRGSPAKPLNDLISIDLTTFALENITANGSPPSPRWGHTSILVGTKMIVIGGRNATSVLSDVHILDFSSKTPTWQSGACGKPMFGHSAVNVKGKIYCFGGRSTLDALSDITLDTIQVYDTLLNTWGVESTLGKNIPCARSNTQAVLVENQHVILTGGTSSLAECQSNIFSLNLSRMIWQQHHPRAEKAIWTSHSMVYDPNTSTCIISGGSVQCFGFGAIYSPIYSLHLSLEPVANKVAPSGEQKNTSNTKELVLVIEKARVKTIKTTLEARGLYDKQRRIHPVEGSKVAFAVPVVDAILHHNEEDDPILREHLQFVVPSNAAASCNIPVTNQAPVRPKKLTKPTEETTKPKKVKSPKVSTPRATKESPKQLAKPTEAPVNSSYGIIVSKESVKSVKTALESLGIYDKTRRIHAHMHEDGVFVVPLLTKDIPKEIPELQGHEVIEDSESTRKPVLNPNVLVHGILKKYADELALSNAPEKFEYIADILLLPKNSCLDAQWNDARIWMEVCSAVPSIRRVARNADVNENEKRQSRVSLLFIHPSFKGPRGNGWVEIRENGLFYGWNIEKVMFSSGNVTEKARMAQIGCANETIVDMYAGIGYYVIPFLVHGKAAHVHALEWNPDSVECLRYNLSRNHVSNRCTVYEGDNRLTGPTLGAIADRVNLGLLPTSEHGWPVAVQVLKPTGGMLHVHENVAIDHLEAWQVHVVSSIKALAAAIGKDWHVDLVHLERVKSYAPKVFHVVADLQPSNCTQLVCLTSRCSVEWTVESCVRLSCIALVFKICRRRPLESIAMFSRAKHVVQGVEKEQSAIASPLDVQDVVSRIENLAHLHQLRTECTDLRYTAEALGLGRSARVDDKTYLRYVAQVLDDLKRARVDSASLGMTWECINDFLSLRSNEARALGFDFIDICLDLHADRVTLALRSSIFQAIIKGQNDCLRRQKALRSVLQDGRLVVPFVNDLGPYLLKLLEVSDAQKELMSLLHCILRRSPRALDIAVLTEMAIYLAKRSDAAMTRADTSTCKRFLKFVTMLSTHRLEMAANTQVCLKTMCGLVNVNGDGVGAWAVMKHLLAGPSGYHFIRGLLGLLEERETSPYILRGAIFIVGMSCWGSQRIPALEISWGTILNSLLQAAAINHGVVVFEMVISIQRLIKKYGEQMHVEWDIVYRFFDVLYPWMHYKAENSTPSTSTSFTPDRIGEELIEILRLMDELVRLKRFQGDVDGFFKVVEMYLEYCPEEAILRLVRHQAWSCHPANNIHWSNCLSDLLLKYFSNAALSTQVRLEALIVLNDILLACRYVCEDQILEHVYIPRLQHIFTDEDTTVRRTGLENIIQHAQHVESSKCFALIDILHQSVISAKYPDAQDIAVNGIVSLFSNLFTEVPLNRAVYLYEKLTGYCATHRNASIRRIAITCLLHVSTANSSYQMQWTENHEIQTSRLLSSSRAAVGSHKQMAYLPIAKAVTAFLSMASTESNAHIFELVITGIHQMLENRFILHDVDLSEMVLKLVSCVECRAFGHAAIADGISKTRLRSLTDSENTDNTRDSAQSMELSARYLNRGFELLLLLASNDSKFTSTARVRLMTTFVHGLDTQPSVLAWEKTKTIQNPFKRATSEMQLGHTQVDALQLAEYTLTHTITSGLSLLALMVDVHEALPIVIHAIVNKTCKTASDNFVPEMVMMALEMLLNLFRAHRSVMCTLIESDMVVVLGFALKALQLPGGSKQLYYLAYLLLVRCFTDSPMALRSALAAIALPLLQNLRENILEEVAMDFVKLMAFAPQSKEELVCQSQKNNQKVLPPTANTTQVSWSFQNTILTMRTGFGMTQIVVRRPSGTHQWRLDTNTTESAHPLHVMSQLFDINPLAHQQLSGLELLQDGDGLTRAMNVLDMSPSYETHKVAVMYLAHPHAKERDVLDILGGSPRYVDFLRGLGDIVQLSSLEGYNGGLDTSPSANDGKYCLIYKDASMQVVFHVATMMHGPLQGMNDEEHAKLESRRHGKKRHLGNDFVHLVYLDYGNTDQTHAKDDIPTLSAQFNDVQIVVQPLDEPATLYRVHVRSKPGLTFGPLKGIHILPASIAMEAVRLTCLNANLACRVLHHQRIEYILNSEDRLKQIKLIGQRFKVSPLV